MSVLTREVILAEIESGRLKIDPFHPASEPKKRTALGRFKHEGAFVTLAKDGRVVVDRRAEG